MSTFEERAEKRRRSWQVRVKPLREEDVTLVDLPADEALGLLLRLSREAWYLQTGEKAPDKVDKSVVKTRRLGDECI